MDAAMEAKLRDMIARDEIWQVMLRYGRGLDRWDIELVRSCYFDEAIEDHGHFIGAPSDFIRWANESVSIFNATQHLLSNHCCEIDGDDAHCETYYIFTGVSPKAPHLISTGRYIDHFQRRKDEWKIANRVTIVEGTFQVEDSKFHLDLPPAYAPGENPASRDRNDVSYQRPVRPRRPRAI